MKASLKPQDSTDLNKFTVYEENGTFFIITLQTWSTSLPLYHFYTKFADDTSVQNM